MSADCLLSVRGFTKTFALLMPPSSIASKQVEWEVSGGVDKCMDAEGFKSLAEECLDNSDLAVVLREFAKHPPEEAGIVVASADRLPRSLFIFAYEPDSKMSAKYNVFLAQCTPQLAPAMTIPLLAFNSLQRWLPGNLKSLLKWLSLKPSEPCEVRQVPRQQVPRLLYLLVFVAYFSAVGLCSEFLTPKVYQTRIWAASIAAPLLAYAAWRYHICPRRQPPAETAAICSEPANDSHAAAICTQPQIAAASYESEPMLADPSASDPPEPMLADPARRDALWAEGMSRMLSNLSSRGLISVSVSPSPQGQSRIAASVQSPSVQ